MSHVSGLLAPGQSRLFRLATSGAFRIELEQQNADFIVEALDENRSVLRTVDAFGWGAETATFSGDISIFFVRVRRAEGERGLASFSLSVARLPYLSHADDIRIKAEDAGTLARAAARRNKGSDPRESVSAARAAAELWKETGDRDSVVRSSLALADALNNPAGGFDEALRLYGADLALARELGDFHSEAECLNNRGVLFRRQASYESAADDLRSALALWRKLSGSTGLAASLNNLALLETDIGEYQSALGHYSEARALLVRAGDTANRAFVDSNLGLIYGRLGDFRASIRSFESAAAVFESAGNGLTAGRALTNSARMYLDAGNLVRAESNVRRGMVLIAPSHDDRAAAEAHNLLGQVLAAENHYEEAETSLRTALELAQKTGDRIAQANSLMNLGLVEIATSRPGEGVDLLESARVLFQQIGTPASEARVLYELALALRASGDLGRAQEMAANAVAILDKLRGTVAAESMRISLLSSTHDYYFALVDILMREGKTVEAWQAAERGRARTLLESLRSGPRSLEERRLVQELNAAVSKLTRDSPDAEASRRHVELLASDLVRVRADNAALDASAVPSPEDVRHALGPDAALVEYAFGQSGGYAWVISAAAVSGPSIVSFSLTDAHTVAVQSDRLAALLGTVTGAPEDRGGAFRRAVESLSKSLKVPEITSTLAVRRLIIVPDGPAEPVPFDLLAAQPRAAIIDKYELVEAPSAAAALALARRRQLQSAADRPRTAVVADAVFDAGDARLGPRAVAHAAAPRFSRLAFSRQEAVSISALRPRGSVSAFLGFDASKDLFTSGDLDNYAVVHISTHGLARNGSEGLVLSLIDRAGSRKDGILSTEDILNLRLNAELVVLGACDSALGTRFAGEGIQSLSRAFLYAGASRVLASRWQIDDQAAATLIEAFYRGMWQDGLTPPAAIRRAQLALRRDPRWRSPFYWASFVLQGEL